MAEKVKIAIIGAASPQWGYTIVKDLLLRLSQDDILERYEPVIVLQDIDAGKLNDFVKLCPIISEKAGNKIKFEITTDQRQALDQARFVIITIAAGSLEAMGHDLEIPQEYGVFMPVGDTVSIGGAIRAARNIPAVLRIANDLEQVGHPKAMIINLSNPMSILCRAITKHSKIKTIGCCHELYNGISFLARIFSFKFDEWKQRLKLEIFGINHCGWIVNAKLDGEDLLQKFRVYLKECSIDENSKRLYDTHNTHLTNHNVKINLFLRYGVLPYSGDRHTSEFFSNFITSQTNKGADYGVLLTSIQQRLVKYRNEGRTKIFDIINKKIEPDFEMSKEAFSRIIAANLTDQNFTDAGNIPYTGNEFNDMPQGAVIESIVTYKPDGIEREPMTTPIPDFVMQHAAMHAGIIENIVEACVNGDKNLLISTLLDDPLLKNMDSDKIQGMVIRLLQLNKIFIHPSFLD